MDDIRSCRACKKWVEIGYLYCPECSLTVKKDSKYRDSIRYLTKKLLKLNILEKLNCEICDNEKVECHHITYDYAASVKWLCKKHHIEEHKALKELIQ